MPDVALQWRLWLLFVLNIYASVSLSVQLHAMSAYLAIRSCFMKYVETKVLKRMESNSLRSGFKESPKKLLLCVSFGVSSMAMLHILDQQYKQQSAKSGRTGYTLHVLHIEDSMLNDEEHSRELFLSVKQRFSSHEYSTLSLEGVLDYDIGDDIQDLGINSESPVGYPQDKKERLASMLSSLTSPYSKIDVLYILQKRLITAFAQQNGYESILHGDSTTRLAEKTLSETAKGRGFALPWLTADGVSPQGQKICYPMRDLLKKELNQYAKMTSPPLDPLVIEKPPILTPPSSRDTTINDLMTQYVESVEQNYPSIVANVVRTSGRLVPPASFAATDPCQLCDLPIDDSAGPETGDQGRREEVPQVNGSGSARARTLCYGCASLLKVH